MLVGSSSPGSNPQSWFRLDGDASQAFPRFECHRKMVGRLRQRLNTTAPEQQESRASFVTRLRKTVNWMNGDLVEEGKYLCANQMERAKDVISPDGAKSKW